ncbi:MAG: hypothetical protein QOG91_397 [Candidatus Parcubacteria bacterium]|jgi:hypothetical protein|nr:hypothetical protein [Candidatus Parcubacteria bacterium]
MSLNIRKSMMRNYFDSQLSNLRSEGINTGEIAPLRDKIPEVIALSSKGNISLLIVIPFAIAPFADQFPKIRLGSKKESYTFLDPALIYDQNPNLPDQPYLITDVDDGRAALNRSPDRCVQMFKLKGRSAGTVNQSLALIIKRPGTLGHHYLQCSGSRIKDVNSGRLYVPDFYVFAGRLKMKREEPDDEDPRWGTLSYRDVIV